MNKKIFEIMTLDVKKTHVRNPDCPSRISVTPDGGRWHCVDCGCEILWKRVNIEGEEV